MSSYADLCNLDSSFSSNSSKPQLNSAFTFPEMSHFRKSPIRFARHGSSQPANPARSPSQPIDSNDNLDKRQKHKSSRITSSHQATVAPNPSSNLFDDHLEKETDSSSHSSYSWSSRNRYKNDFRDSGGLQSQTVEELENYAAYKAEETTNAVNNCLKIAEDMREDATNTLVALHHQGEQITRTHMVTADIDNDLSRVRGMNDSSSRVILK